MNIIQKQASKLGLLGAIVVLVVACGSTALMLSTTALADHGSSTDNQSSTEDQSSTDHGGDSSRSTPSDQSSSEGDHSGTDGTESHSSSGSERAAEARANGQEHLAAAKLKACQNREKAVNNIMSRIDTRTQNQVKLFGTIATRVENFYSQKGNTLSNYDQLVAAVNAAADQVDTDLSNMKANSTFNCSSTNPKGMVDAFQGSLKTATADLQNYRRTVRNLTVGVASVNGVDISDVNQSSSGGQR